MNKLNAYRKEQAFSEQSKKEIIIEYAPVIKNIAIRCAKRFAPYISIEDMINVGVIGLIDAIEKYNESLGVKFRTYAEYRIRGAMLDELRKFDWVPRSMRDKIKALERVFTRLEQKFSRTPTTDELAQEMGVPVERVHSILFNSAKCSLISLNELEDNSAIREKKYLPSILLQSDDEIIAKTKPRES